MTEASAVRIPTDTKDELQLLGLNVAVSIRRNISMGEMIAILLLLANKHRAEVIEIAKERMLSENKC